jgi:hypothetical protein
LKRENNQRKAKHRHAADCSGAYARQLRLLALFVLLPAMGFQAAQSSAESSGEESASVLTVVSTLFDGMRNKDAQKLRSVFSADASLGGTPVEKFVENVLASKAHLDEVTFDETVLIDGELAMAWTPYNIFVDGVFHHCGVDLFVMRKTDGEWKIRYLEDTRREEGCDEFASAGVST